MSKRQKISDTRDCIGLAVNTEMDDDVAMSEPNEAEPGSPQTGDGFEAAPDPAQLPTTLVLTEHPDARKFEFLVRHPDVRNQNRCGLAAYVRAVGSGGELTVTYERKGPGRFYPKTAETAPTRVEVATHQQRAVRATLFGETHLDIDMVNCHPRLLHALVRDCAAIPSSKYTRLDRRVCRAPRSSH